MAERLPPPVFLLMRDLPRHNGEWYTTRELCGAAERVAGFESMYGAQKYHGTWRLYPNHAEARQALLFQGIEVRGVTVQPYDTNPTHYKDKNNVRIPTTRLTVGNIPLSHNNDDILEKLKQIGVNVLSEVIMEKDRDADKKLTRFRTGNRILYIETPKQPLPRSLQLASYKVSLFHIEQKEQGKDVSCTRCLEAGHTVTQCVAPDIVCRTCKASGHKAGDARCEGIPPVASNDPELPLPPASILTPLDLSHVQPTPPPHPWSPVPAPPLPTPLPPPLSPNPPNPPTTATLPQTEAASEASDRATDQQPAVTSGTPTPTPTPTCSTATETPRGRLSARRQSTIQFQPAGHHRTQSPRPKRPYSSPPSGERVKTLRVDKEKKETEKQTDNATRGSDDKTSNSQSNSDT